MTDPNIRGINLTRFYWTEEAVDRLVALWADGRSASQIAEIFGAGVTRNSVIGKVHRLGLSGSHRIMDERAMSEAKRKAELARLRAARKNAERRKRLEEQSRMPARKRVQDKVTPLRRAWADEPQAGGVHIYDHRPGQCRFPIRQQDGSWSIWCGAPVEKDGASYCTHHSCIAYRCEVVAKEAA